MTNISPAGELEQLLGMPISVFVPICLIALTVIGLFFSGSVVAENESGHYLLLNFDVPPKRHRKSLTRFVCEPCCGWSSTQPRSGT
jgi:hypothetical protein